MRLALPLAAIAAVVAAVRVRRSAEVWHLAPDPASDHTPGHPVRNDEGP
ncbi:hypothetical protein [Mycobacterium gastri]|nr:hypothetical protein [Mycobacterium gastri]